MHSKIKNLIDFLDGLQALLFLLSLYSITMSFSIWLDYYLITHM